VKNYKFMAILLVIAFSLGAFYGPKKTEIKEVEKIVYKESSETKKNVKKTTKKKETINPDGSKTIETITESDSSTHKNTDKSLDSDKSKQTTTTARNDWFIFGTYRPDIQSYGVGIQRRVIGEIYLGAFVNQDKTYGMSIGIGF
jgi:hypothetical protein